MSNNNLNSNRPVKAKIPEDLQELEAALTSVNPKVFDGLSRNKRIDILQSLSFTLIQEKSHSGPLPDAETLIQYDSVIPGGADRIMKMAEKQQSHRISIETKVVSSQSSQSKLGQVFGLIIGLAGIGCGTYLASVGQDVVGGIIAGGTVVSLVSVFVLGKKSSKKKS
ncbi:DUF2335 domain-containing protein [Tenacibaculum maritimum]|uniref:DUF2335 domain-containing protein n=2 Tax=Tenacibaculum maritimum TaxID=107401 RepID=UPI0023077DEF|nr:DUF2335 domain-containing protein [Tenacibaculum maritimum]MDB0610630.1 DUF2335 domain-containing protein [Tenacibaculum maritimum]